MNSQQLVSFVFRPLSSSAPVLPCCAILWLSLAAVLLLSPTAHAQSYTIDWSTVDGGGGTSTGGVYSVSGTIGQADAGGPMTNGQHSVTGGFWALPTGVQVPGAPMLTIAPATPGNATISWSPNTPGFVLQQTWSLSRPPIGQFAERRDQSGCGPGHHAGTVLPA